MPFLKEPSYDSSEQRARLLDQQSKLLRALVCRQQIPPQFDASRVQAAARALTRKRCHDAAKAWPALVRWLGEDFSRRFDAYAQTSLLPPEGGPLADGWSFGNSLARSEPLPIEVRQARFVVSLRYAWRPSGLRPRRAPAIKILLLRRSLRLLLGLYWPLSSSDTKVRIKVVAVTWSKVIDQHNHSRHNRAP